ncbi:MAG TPA: MFS transporter [Terriglobia bacterium]|nr:MFS transporter [Terriglobia bacterium]
MNPESGSARKFTTVGFLWATQVVSFMIRYALGIVAPTLMSLYHISPETMGYILSGWNWAYTGALPFVGPVVDRFGPWITMGGGTIVWGLSTAALPLAATAAALFAMRFLFGFGHSMLIPTTSTSVSRCFPAQERARAIAVAFSGNQVGLAIGATVSAYIMARLGWPAVFYFLGGLSLVLGLAWFLFFPDKSIGRVSDPREGPPGTPAPQRVAWTSLLAYRSTWGIAFGQFGYLYAYYFFISWLPTYLVRERQMTVLATGIFAALPFWVGMLGTLGGGWLGDYLIARGVSTTVSRKSIIGFGLSGSTVFVLSAAFVNQAWAAGLLLTLSVGFLRLATGSCNSTPIDLAPRSAVGSLTSIQNFFGNAGGLLAPIVTGYIVGNTGSFVYSLVVAGGMALFGAVCYVFLVGNLETGRIQPTPSGVLSQKLAA